MSVAEPYSSVSPHFSTEKWFRAIHGPTTIRHAVANARMWLHADRMDLFASHRPFNKTSKSMMGIKTMKGARVRHSKPRNIPARAKYRMRDDRQAFTANSAKIEYNETVMLSVIVYEKRSALAERLPIASTPAIQNTRALPKISSADSATASTPSPSRKA